MKTPRPFVLAALCALAANGPSLMAQAKTLEASAPEVVNLDPFTVTSQTDKGWIATRSATATKTNIPLTDLAHRVSILNSEFMADAGADTVLDAIKYVGGASAADRRTDNQNVPIGVKLRGFNISTRQDGYIQGQGFFRLDLAGVERLELMKGASALLFGNTAPGGILNYVSKIPRNIPATQISVSAGEYNYYKGVLDTTGPLWKSADRDLAYRTIVSYRDAESPRDFEFEKSIYLHQSFRLRWNAHSLILKAEYQDVDGREAIARPYGNFENGGFRIYTLAELPLSFFRGEPADYKNASQSRFEARGTLKISDSWIANLSARTGRANIKRHESFIGGVPAGQPSNIRTRDSQDVYQYGDNLNFDLDVLGTHQWRGIKNELLLGYSWNGSWNRALVTNRALTGGPLTGGWFNMFNPVYDVYTFGPVRANANTRGAGRSWGYYAQDQIKLFKDRLIVVAGVRHDEERGRTYNYNAASLTYNDLAKTSPRYSALFKLRDEVSIYAAVNEAFQGRPGGIKSGTVNTPLDPQESKTEEAGVKLNLFNGNLYADFAVFSVEQSNLAVPDINFPGTPFQLQSGVVTSDGWEVELNWNVTTAWQLYGGYAYSDIRVTSDTNPARLGKRPTSTPTRSGGLFTKYSFFDGVLKGFSVGAGATYFNALPGDFNNTFYVDGATVYSAMLRYDWNRRYTLVLNVENALDDEYTAGAESTSFAVPGDPRWARLTFTAKF